MDAIPSVKVTRFEQLEPGDLFLFMDREDSYFALKTQLPANGARCEMVLLGPTFPDGLDGSALVGRPPATAVSFGKGYAILLPTDAKAWSLSNSDRASVCLAIGGEDAYVCTNGAAHSRGYFQCFVDIRTGKILERSLPGEAAYTTDWEIAILSAKHPPRTIIKYPLARPSTKAT